MKITLNELKKIIRNEIKREKERLNENKYFSYNSGRNIKSRSRLLMESDNEIDLTDFELDQNLLDDIYFDYSSVSDTPEFDSSYKKNSNIPKDIKFSQYFKNNHRISVNDDNKIEIIPENSSSGNYVFLMNDIIRKNNDYKIYFSNTNKEVYLSEFHSDTDYEGNKIYDGDFSFDAPQYVLILNEDEKKYIVFELKN